MDAVSHETGELVPLRCLLDTGSEANFITEKFVNLLGLRQYKSNVIVQPLGGNNKVTEMAVDLSVIPPKQINKQTSSSGGASCNEIHTMYTIKCIVIDIITGITPANYVTCNIPVPHDLLADAEFQTPDNIDALIGVEFYNEIMETNRVKSNGLYFQDTKFGYTVSGTAKFNQEEQRL